MAIFPIAIAVLVGVLGVVFKFAAVFTENENQKGFYNTIAAAALISIALMLNAAIYMEEFFYTIYGQIIVGVIPVFVFLLIKKYT